ncbi:hypothetical protein DYU02_02430 [Listeria monocytogenes]|uniref:Uncharacterized protein n=1 Tax=Listeria monocytogenes TaxID=1639 RepID=A0A9P1WUM6_LISMN|nr:hypothetical protein [Listeria monocytogenes]EAC5550261.1 hypothetical protein [Listeria monocytogenes]EAC9283094.1 hypothetical protein [Listeria monocytogenes]EAC9294485.1 hypothetical protein [Listeria monocytogenes]MCX30614.1 hypothetical protein [Listeria monocytogenes]
MLTFCENIKFFTFPVYNRKATLQKKMTTGYRDMTDESKEQHDYIIFERKMSSGLVRIEGKNIIVINMDLSQNDKLEDIARLLNKI